MFIGYLCITTPCVCRFNYRSTHHMVQEGFYNFLNWFDERAWYPLGRIVGGTVSMTTILVRPLSSKDCPLSRCRVGIHHCFHRHINHAINFIHINLKQILRFRNLTASTNHPSLTATSIQTVVHSLRMLLHCYFYRKS